MTTRTSRNGERPEEIGVVLVGLGGSGLRFARACIALRERPGGRPRIVAGVDPSPERRARFAELGIACHETIEAVEAMAVDLAIVTTPEHQHLDCLRRAKAHFPVLRRMICEKPLANDAQGATALREFLSDDELTINFVERFSPIVEQLRRYIREQRRRVHRVSSFWGKYRAGDPRPTTGVAAVELCHPLDLALMLADVPTGSRFEIASALACGSNFHSGADGKIKLDTIHAALRFESGPELILASSLLWSRRRRTIEILLASEEGHATELAVLTFDDPQWDLDRLEILGVNELGGSLTPIVAMDVAPDFWPSELLTVGKVSRFLEANLAELRGEQDSGSLLPRLDHGIYVEQILEAIAEAAERNALVAPVFRAPQVAGQRTLAREIDLLVTLAAGGVAAPETYSWDSID